jgi:hypothetical protein
MYKDLKDNVALDFGFIFMSIGLGLLISNFLFKNSVEVFWGIICLGIGIFISLMVVSGEKSKLDSHVIAQGKKVNPRTHFKKQP